MNYTKDKQYQDYLDNEIKEQEDNVEYLDALEDLGIEVIKWKLINLPKQQLEKHTHLDAQNAGKDYLVFLYQC